MANKKNLKPQAHKLTLEEQSNGGKASVKARRKRKEFKEALKLALTVVMDNDKTVQEIGIEALMERFMKGDPKVFELVRNTIGEAPTEKQEVKVVDSEWFK